MTQEFLEREYNPRVQIPHFAAVFARWRMQGKAICDTVPARLDLSYGSAPAEKLDFFPARGASNPLLMFVHGGYWRALDKADFTWLAPPYVAQGISVALVNYGLTPATPLAEIVIQMRRACTWLFREGEALGIDRARIYCAGHSAGGHLTGILLASDWPSLASHLPSRLLAGGVAISGLFDLEPLRHADFLRHDLALDAAGARALSPIFLPWRNHAPLLRAVGALESAEFHRQSTLIGEHWPEACRTDVIDVPGCDHLSVCDALASPGNVLFEAVSSMVLRNT